MDNYIFIYVQKCKKVSKYIMYEQLIIYMCGQLYIYIYKGDQCLYKYIYTKVVNVYIYINN